MSGHPFELLLETDSTPSSESLATPAAPSSPRPRLDGVVIGILVGLPDTATPLVAFPGNPDADCLTARSTTTLSRDDIGGQIALLFEDGDPHRPIVIGRIQHPEATAPAPPARQALAAEMDGERLVLTAEREIVLRCGKASITLTKAGKILIRGAYLSSRSSGVNRIKGGSVQVN